MGLTVLGAADAAMGIVWPLVEALAAERDRLAAQVRRLAEQNGLGHQGLKDAEEEAFRQRRRADRLADQLRALAAGADPLCRDHGDQHTSGCQGCRYAAVVAAARKSLDGPVGGGDRCGLRTGRAPPRQAAGPGSYPDLRDLRVPDRPAAAAAAAVV